MKTLEVVVIPVVVVVLLLIASPTWAVPLTVDDFEDGTTMGWHVGDPDHPAPPANISSGGPAGAGDAYLQLSAFGGTGEGSRLSVLNLSQWTGDFTQVSGIAMDVNNFGPESLVLRLLFVNFSGAPGMSPPSAVAWTLAPVAIPAGSGWTPAFFSLASANLFSPLGGVPLALGGADELRIFHSVAPGFGGPGTGGQPVVAIVGLDNIRAVPEPSSLFLLLSGFGAALRRRRSR